MNDRSMRLRLGAFVILAFCLLGAMVFMFGSLPGLFKRTSTYTVRFTDAPGLAPGAPVRRSGVRIGEVREVRLDEDSGIVRVRLAIDSPYRLRRSDEATLVVGLLGSDAGIDFIPKVLAEGDPVDREPVEVGAELAGRRAATVNSLLRGASEVVPTSQEALNDLRKSAARLEKFVARLEKSIPTAEETLIEYTKLAKSANQQIPELQKTNVEIREFIKEVRGMTPQIEKTLDEYRLLAQDTRRAIPRAEKLVDNIDGAVKSIRETIPSVQKTIEDFGSAARSVQRSSEDLNRVVMENKEGIRVAVTKFNKNLDDLKEFLSEDNKKNVSESLQKIRQTLNDQNIRRLEQLLANISGASDQFPKLTKNADAAVVETRDLMKRLTTTLEKADTALSDVGKLTGPFSARGERISRNIDEALQSANATLSDIRSLMKVLDRADGTLRRVLTDPSLYNNLDRTVMALNRLFPQVELILKDAGVFADKIARHPERLGIGGAIRPDDGLKGPPTPPRLPNNGILVVPPQR